MKTGQYQYTESEFDPITEFSEPYRSYVRDILAGHYAPVMESMAENMLWRDDSSLNQLQEKYFYLRKYYLSGAEDPAREGFLREIGRELMHLLRTKTLLQGMSTQPYYARTMTERELAEHGLYSEDEFVTRIHNLRSYINQPDAYYPTLEVLFDYLWVGDITIKGADAVVNLLHDEEHTIAGIHLLSAIYLGMLQCFDAEKLSILIRVVTEPMTDALVGTALPILLILGRRYQQELLSQYPKPMSDLRRLITSNPDLNDATYKAIIEVYHAYSTTRDHQIFMENVMPKLEELKSRLDFSNSSNIAQQIQDLTEHFSEEETSEIQELMESAAKRMEDFDATGHDVEYHSMKEMKTTPFFGTVSHWFLPYDPRHPLIDAEVASLIEEYGTVIFKGRKNIISSDMYSVATFPQWAPVMAQLAQLKDAFPQSDASSGPRSLTDYMRDFLFGAYRFHYLSSARLDFYNPFADKPYLLDGAFTQVPYLFPEEKILLLAGFFAKERHYIAAGSTYERLVAEQGIESGEAWRGIAVTRMIRKDFNGALSALYSAMDAEGMTSVTVTKAANILHDLGREEEELTLITRAEAEIDDSCLAGLVERKSQILLKQGEVEKALESAFKAVYLSDRKSESAVLTLARTLLIAQRPADAFGQLEDDDNLPHKQWMKGVAQIAMNDRAKGIERLRTIHSGAITSREKKETLSLLSNYGILPWEQALILDTTQLKDNL